MEIERLISIADYIIDKDRGFLGEEYMLSSVAKAKYYFDQNKDKFELLEKIKWPDSSYILIYKKKIQVTKIHIL